jgi:hypothetical protein
MLWPRPDQGYTSNKGKNCFYKLHYPWPIPFMLETFQLWKKDSNFAE